MESFALVNRLRPAPPILVKGTPYPGRRIEVAFCFFGGDAPKEARPQSGGMSNSFSLLLFLLSETHLPSSGLWGRGKSKKEQEKKYRRMRILEKGKEKEKRAEDNPSQQVHPRAESRQSISFKRFDANPLSSAFFLFLL